MPDLKTDKNCGIGIYVRESRDDKGENFETIENQISLLTSYVKNNFSGEIFKVYLDDNVSGSGFERPGLSALKSDVERGCIDLLLLKDLSRLGRNNARTLLFLDYLEEAGVRVLTLDGRYDSSKDNDTVGIDTWYNERYVRDISRKIRANLRHKIEKGEYLGHPPFGYKKSDSIKNRLVIDETRAIIVREIFQLYREGLGYSSIAGKLNQRKCPSPSSGISGNACWSPVAVGRILKNRVYTGATVQGVSQRISFKNKKSRRLPEEQWVITENTHEAIISIKEFEAVAKIINSASLRHRPHKSAIHIFKGLLMCGNCGSTMIARKRPNRPMGYICGNYARYGAQSCESHHVNESELVKTVAAEIADRLQNESIKSRLAAFIRNEIIGKENASVNAVKLKSELDTLVRQQDILYNDRLQGKITEQLFLRTNKAIENKILYVSEMIRKAENSAPAAFNSSVLIDELNHIFIMNEITNQIAQIIIDKIIIFRAGDVIAHHDIEQALNPAGLEELIEKGGVVIFYKFG